MIILAFGGASCTPGGGGAPVFTGPANAPAAAVSTPAVDDEMAKLVGAQKIIYHVGPIDLPAGTTIDAMLDRPLKMRFQTDKEIWVTGFTPRVVDSNGNELPSGLLHSAMMLNMHEENPLCAGAPNPFMYATSTLTEVELPRGFGYPVLPTDPLEARVVLSNPTDKPYSDVFFEIVLVARSMDAFSSMRDVKPMFLELDPCNHAPVDSAPRAFSKKSATYQVPEASNMVVALGVLQDFGAAVELTSGTDIMPFWRTEAIKNEKHVIEDMTDNPFVDTEGKAFKSGDRITLGLSYDNASDKWLVGATAGAMIYLAPKE